MNNILITGSEGQLGQALKYLEGRYPYKLFFCNRQDLDITDIEAVDKFVLDNSIDSIINAAAYTAVDLAELQESAAYAVNFIGIQNLAKVAKDYHLKLIHVSTDYVFEGEVPTPYTEDMPTRPQSVYGQSKLKGEQALRYINPENAIIIRTSWLYSQYKQNFLKTILKLAQTKDQLQVVYDQVGTPTYAEDLAHTILEILPKIETQQVQIYHYANEGVGSWYDFAHEILNYQGCSCQLLPVESSRYPTLAPRPKYSVLNKQKIKQAFGLHIPYWKDSLLRALKKSTKEVK